MTPQTTGRKAIGFAVASAALFGASMPLAKVLLPGTEPQLLAGLLYLGSGTGLGVYSALRRTRVQEARLMWADIPWLAAAIVAGGILGPLLLMWGLVRTPASITSLFLNLEGVFTASLAWFVFRENFDRRIALGMGLIVAGGVCLSWKGPAQFGVGVLSIAGACLAWGIDNNLTRKVSASDPVRVASLKGLVAGSANAGLALARGASWPTAGTIVLALVVGLLSYGVSLVLFVLALRHLGTARTGAYYSTAPFVGAGLSIALLAEPIGWRFGIAALLMGTGVWLHLTERHAHWHRHDPTFHDHLHTHDDHHQHRHSPADPPGEPHTHPHQHQELTHNHPHFPDIHHRHHHH